MRDPARKVRSTHRASPTRTYVMNQLGISKPGFWADWKYRVSRGQTDDEEEGYDPSMPSMQRTDYKPFKTVEFEGEEASERPAGGSYRPSQSGATATSTRGDPRATKQFKKQLNAVVSNNAKYLTTRHPTLSTSSSDLLAAEKIGTANALSQAFAAALRKDPHALLNKVATDYYFNKAKNAAVDRANIPFGHGLPTTFEKMQAALAKPKPVIKGNSTNAAYAQQQKMAQKQQQMAQNGKPKPSVQKNLNVKQNGYASSYVGFAW